MEKGVRKMHWTVKPVTENNFSFKNKWSGDQSVNVYIHCYLFHSD